MKTAISIPDKVFRSADSLAKRLGVTRSQLDAHVSNVIAFMREQAYALGLR